MLYIYGLILFLSLGYGALMAGYCFFWARLAPSFLSPNYQPKKKISIVLAARNEEEHIESCLRSLLAQDYPPELMEVILVDDHSEDATRSIAESFQDDRLHIIALQKGLGKKAALAQAIAAAQGEYLLFTDADCQLPPLWAKQLCFPMEQENMQFVAAPVLFSYHNRFLEKAQALDFMGMMAITGAGINGQYMRMCNGANMAYPKARYIELNGFAGMDQLASGDDMLFLQKVAEKYPQQIAFVKSLEAAVQTPAVQTYAAFWRQRLRWSSKSGAYKDRRTELQLGLVWAFSCSLFISSIALFFGFSPYWVLGQWALKALADYGLLSSASRFFQRRQLLRIFWPALLAHLLYIVLVGTASLFPQNYQWKGRSWR